MTCNKTYVKLDALENTSKVIASILGLTETFVKNNTFLRVFIFCCFLHKRLLKY